MTPELLSKITKEAEDLYTSYTDLPDDQASFNQEMYNKRMYQYREIHINAVKPWVEKLEAIRAEVENERVKNKKIDDATAPYESNQCAAIENTLVVVISIMDKFLKKP